MRKFMLVVCCIGLLSSGCTGVPTGQLQEVKIVGHVPTKEQGAGIAYCITYEHWICENTVTKERFTSIEKYGEIGEVIKIRR